MAYTMKIDLTDMPFIYNLSDTVGPNMPNYKADVQLVQCLLKIVGYYTVGGDGFPRFPFFELKPTGYLDRNTIDCMNAFEEYLKLKHKIFQSDANIHPSGKDGFTKGGFLYKIVHLNRAAKENQENDFRMLPFSSIPPELKAGILPGAPPLPKRDPNAPW
jgi:hypothetical protein